MILTRVLNSNGEKERKRLSSSSKRFILQKDYGYYITLHTWRFDTEKTMETIQTEFEPATIIMHMYKLTHIK